MNKMEDKQKICDLLLATLQATRSGADLTELTYNSTAEVVILTFEDGYTKECNVACDSGCAMINDIMRAITL